MKTIGNIIWFFLTGLEGALIWLGLGLLWCITIIGIPFGKQCFKMADLCAWPFGKTVKSSFGKHPIANIIWLLLGGLEFGLVFGLVGAVWCVTIIGIPFGKQCFKMAELAFVPFGAEIA